jgi:hypothetical protein
MARGHDGHKDGQEGISAIKTAREDVSTIEMARRAWRRSKRETEGRGQDILLGRLKIGERGHPPVPPIPKRTRTILCNISQVSLTSRPAGEGGRHGPGRFRLPSVWRRGRDAHLGTDINTWAC